MGDKVQVDEVENVLNSSGIPTINENFEELADEFDLVHYRDGSQAATDNWDMDSNRILNLPTPLTPAEPLRLDDLLSALDGSYTPPSSSEDISFQVDSVVRTVEEKLLDFRTFEDFGAVGDYVSDTGLGTDDTAAIQAAIDWANGDTWRAIKMTAKNFLCGAITTYPGTTVIGTGRMTSAFWCKTGTTGKWWSDRGDGAAKTMLSGITWYARNNTAITHILDLGSAGTPSTQFGTEGILEGLWLRDAPNGFGLCVSGNAGIIHNVAIWNCRTDLKVLGNANQLSGIVLYGSGLGTTGAIAGGPANVIGGDLAGCQWSGIHVEAAATLSLPLKVNGDCSGVNTTISSAAGTSFSHLVEVDVSVYTDVWNLVNLQILGSGYTITNGLLKVGANYFNGTSVSPRVVNHFSRAAFLGFIQIANSTPVSASATGTRGTICWDENFIYICTATDTWKRIAISTW